MRRVGGIIGRSRVAVVVVFALVLAGLVAVGQPSSVAAGVTIVAQNFSFVGPNGNGDVTIPVGTTVTWTNGGGIHTTTSDAMPPLWDSPVNAGSPFPFTFTQIGVFPYHCTFHGAPGTGMHGTITVVAGPPATPTGLHITSATTSSVTWGWTPPDATSNIAVSDGAIVTNLTPNTTTFTKSGLAPGAYVCLSVAAYNGGGASAWSAFVCGPEVPLMPTGLHVSGATNAGVSFAWTDPDASSAIALGVGTTGGTAYAGLAPGTAASSQLVAAGYWVCAQVAAYNASYASNFTNWVCGLAVPAAPTGIHVTGHSPTSVTFGWTDSDPYSGIAVSNGTAVTTVAAGGTSYMQSGMATNSWVCVSLAAYNSAGASPWTAATTGWVCGQATA